jgi:hypothetical protein
VFLAAFVTYLPRKLKAPGWVVWGSSLFLLSTIVVHPLLLSQINAWIRGGWSGSDAAEMKAVDFIASEVKPKGKDHAAIGYDIYLKSFNATLNAVDSRYKVGARLDLLFKARHGILNTDRCAEGFSSDDEYRIVQTKAGEGPDASRDHFDIPSDPRFEIVQEFESHRVLRRF